MHAGLELESRRRIYEYLAANPGVHLRRIGQALGMSTGMLSYHLGVMEKLGLLKSEAARHRRRYYPSQVYREDQRKILALLREPVPRRILVDLATWGERSFAELLRTAGVTKSTLSYHLAKLVSSGVAVRRPSGRRRVLTLQDSTEVVSLILACATSIADETVGRFVSIWPRIQDLRRREASIATPLAI